MSTDPETRRAIAQRAIARAAARGRQSRRTPGEPDVIKTSLENRTFGRLLSAFCHSLGDCEPQEIAKVARPSFVNGTEIFADDGKALREYF